LLVSGLPVQVPSEDVDYENCRRSFQVSREERRRAGWRQRLSTVRAAVKVPVAPSADGNAGLVSSEDCGRWLPVWLPGLSGPAGVRMTESSIGRAAVGSIALPPPGAIRKGVPGRGTWGSGGCSACDFQSFGESGRGDQVVPEADAGMGPAVLLRSRRSPGAPAGPGRPAAAPLPTARLSRHPPAGLRGASAAVPAAPHVPRAAAARSGWRPAPSGPGRPRGRYPGPLRPRLAAPHCPGRAAAADPGAGRSLG
jgi:hypothetical protein